MASFSYHKGGRLLNNIEVIAIFARTQKLNSNGNAALPDWIDPSTGRFVSEVCSLNYFLRDIVSSAYITLLANEYSVLNGPQIGQGTSKGSFILEIPIEQPANNNSFIISYTDIQNALDSSISNGIIPPPSSNTCYVIYIVGTKVKNPNSNFTDGFHHSFNLANGVKATYCFVNADAYFDQITYVTSHELAEAITNPDFDAWSWLDDYGNEICDVCDPSETVSLDDLKNIYGSIFHGYTVCRFWSRQKTTCIAPPDDNLKLKGYININFSPLRTDGGCVKGIIENQMINFRATAYLNSIPISAQNFIWTTSAQALGPINQQNFSIQSPPAHQSFNVEVTAFDEFGCELSQSKIFSAISLKEAELQELLCKLKHEILYYWRFINDPERSIAVNPVSEKDIHAIKTFSRHFTGFISQLEKIYDRKSNLNKALKNK
jgi:hypothetical protein